MPPDRTYNTWGQLAEASLTEIKFRLNPDFVWERDADGARYSIDSHVEAAVADDRAHGAARLRASFTFHNDDDHDVPFDLELEVTGQFVGFQPDLPDEEIEGWLTFNAQHLLWPYLRSYVSQITGNSGLPSLTIYTIHVPRPHLGRSDVPAEARSDIAGPSPADSQP